MSSHTVREMEYDDYINWILFFNARPIGWREDDRTMKLLQAQGVEARPEAVFPSLATMKADVVEEQQAPGMVSGASLRGSGLFARLQTAVGGDKLNL